MIKRSMVLFIILPILTLLIIFSSCTSSPALPLTTTNSSSTTVPAPTPSPTPIPAPAPQVQIQWLGQSIFLITSSQGTKILADPSVAAVGYAVTPIEGVDVITVSHEHTDHNNVSLATGSPMILRGLISTSWNTVDQRVKDVHIFSISPANPIYHDNTQGSQRGRNSIFVFEMDGLRIAHLGDLGHVLSQESVQALGAIDAVLVPVGGAYTIDAAGATQVVNQLNPRIVIPMHYKTPKVPATWPGTGVEPFLDGKNLVERPNSSVAKLSRTSLPTQTTIVILNYE